MLVADPGALHTPWRQTTYQRTLEHVTLPWCADSTPCGLRTLTTPPEVSLIRGDPCSALQADTPVEALVR